MASTSGVRIIIAAKSQLCFCGLEGCACYAASWMVVLAFEQPLKKLKTQSMINGCDAQWLCWWLLFRY
jgi:hypothetical protein